MLKYEKLKGAKFEDLISMGKICVKMEQKLMKSLRNKQG